MLNDNIEISFKFSPCLIISSFSETDIHKWKSNVFQCNLNTRETSIAIKIQVNVH